MPQKSIKSNIATNIASLLTSNITDRAANFIFYLLVGRYLGSFAFGQLTLALTYFQLFQIFAMLGIKKVIIREVAKNRDYVNQYLMNGSMLVLLSSILAIIIQWIFIRLMGYAADTSYVISLLSLALIPFSLAAVCEAVFQAWERMHYITYANVPVNILKIVVAFLLFELNYGLIQVAVMWVVARFIIVCIEWLLMVKHIAKPQLCLSIPFSVEMVKSSGNFFGIDGLNAIGKSINTLILSKLATETEIGLYNAANQFSVPVIIIITNIGQSVFPVLCKEIASGIKRIKRIIEGSTELLLAVAIPAAVGLFVLADSALLFIYGEGFSGASDVLRIIAWVLILRAITQILGLTLLAHKKENIALRITIITTSFQFVISYFLISQFGLMGVAFSSLIVWMLNFSLHYFENARHFFRVALGKLIWKPALASAVMALYLYAVREGSFLLVVFTAALLYAGCLFIIAIKTNGGVRQLKAKYLNLWVK